MEGVRVECVLVSHASNGCSTAADTTGDHCDCGRDSKTDTGTARQRPVTSTGLKAGTETNTTRRIWLVRSCGDVHSSILSLSEEILYLFWVRGGKQIISSARCPQLPDEPAQNKRRGSGPLGS